MSEIKQLSGMVLKGGTIVDGTGTHAKTGDVVIQDDRIVSVGEAGSAVPWTAIDGFRVLDCTGYVVAPGFIDAHSHSDLQVLRNRTEKLVQGVTAEVVGNCGFSPYPMADDPQITRNFANGILFGEDAEWGWDSAADYLKSASHSETATVVSLVGHGSLRIKVAGDTSRELTSAEIDVMCGLLDDALQQGAAGFSSGLMYAPGSGASASELIALARVAAKRNKIYATHMRSYSAGLIRAVDEQIAIASAADCRLQISHLQAAGENHWPLFDHALNSIEQASSLGVDVAFDAYPWLAGSTVLTQILPQDALDGGTWELLKRLSDPVQRESIRPRIKPSARWSGVVITSAVHNESALVGRSIQDIAGERGLDPATTTMDLLLEQEGHVLIVEHSQSEENLRKALTHPLAMVVTDGVYTSGRSHPRLYGTFPLLMSEMVREKNWLSLEDAIHKVTQKPADAFHMDDRGRIAAECVADIVIFDAASIHTDATYEMPATPPVGIRFVIRNGNVAVDGGIVQPYQ